MLAIQKIGHILTECRQALEPEHIRDPSVLCDAHPLRRLVALAAVNPFLRRYTSGTFPYERELGEVDGFAQDLLKAVSETLVTDNLTVADKTGDPTVWTSIFVEDVLTGVRYCP